MPEWPTSLIHEIGERRCIPVLGAGVSRSCVGADNVTRPPGWRSFLSDAVPLVDKTAGEHINELLAKDNFLDAAQILVTSVSPPDFSDYVRRRLVEPNFTHSPLHDLIAQLDAKVVLTTNYDRIYEQYCSQTAEGHAYNVCKYYEAHAINDLRSTTRSILKIHGCVSDPTQIILARTQYLEARKAFQPFYALLDALFLTNTLLFIGCGLDDPDIAMLLENVNIRAPSQHPHYALVEGGRHAAIAQSLLETQNLKLLEYEQGCHNEVEDSLEALVKQVKDWRSTHD